MPSLRTVRQRMAGHRPTLHAGPEPPTLEAAVALVLYEAPGSGRPELLFIQRAEREGDPWSGHMAFPGGRRQDEDPDAAGTALRETHEEVGFAPDRILGRLDDLVESRRGIPRLVVSALVCEVEQRPRVYPNHEVSDSIWIPLDWILSKAARAEHRPGESAGGSAPRPAFRYERYVVWGLTYRILGGFFSVVGETLSSDERR